MNRFMVWMGLGSLLCFLSTSTLMPAHAEMPREWISNIYPSDPQIAWHETLESGWQESRRRNVPMVIYITSENCRYCDAMKRETWRNRSIRERIAKGFVAIRLMPHRNSATLSRINVEMYPTTLVGIPRGKIIAHQSGFQPAAAVHGLLSAAEQ